uniref:DM domain-containing protein n=1 Tax=Meloidogyne floridensis TaxID=298350 RepID=A0A915PB12_9BILA
MSNEDNSCQHVKRFCGICRQHGKMEETRGHICEFKDCECQKCNLVRSRRLVMSQQIRLRRAQDKRFQRTDRPEEADVIPLLTPQFQQQLERSTSPQQPTNGLIVDDEIQQQMLDINGKNMCYFCQKCKNHGVLVWKKQHKRQCPFTNCSCDFCELIETRRRLDQHLVVARHKNEGFGKGKSSRNKLNLEKGEEENKNSENEENILTEEPPTKKKSTISINLVEEENEIACTSSKELGKNIKLQQEPLEDLNKQIWNIQNKQQLSPKNIKSRNSSFSSVDSFSTLREMSVAPLINDQQQQLPPNQQQFLFNNLNTNISSPPFPPNNLPNFLPTEQQQQQQTQKTTPLDQFLLNCLNQTILPLNSPNSKNFQQNSESGNLINETENNELQKNILLQIIAQLLQEQQKNKIAETIIGAAHHQAFLRNLILTGNTNRNTEMFPTFLDSTTIFATNLLAAQQGLFLPKNNSSSNISENNEQQQLQIQSAFNILQSGFGLL